MATIKKEKLQQFIAGLNGKFFTVTFTKKDGTQRRMTARTRVKKGIKGTGSYSHTGDITRSNITVFDTAKLAFRAVPLDRTSTIKARGTLYHVQ